MHSICGNFPFATVFGFVLGRGEKEIRTEIHLIFKVLKDGSPNVITLLVSTVVSVYLTGIHGLSKRHLAM